MKKIGIDCGASQIKLACTENGAVIYTAAKEHFGAPLKVLRELIAELAENYPECSDFPAALCGSCVPDIIDKDCIISDIPAITEGAKLLCPEAMSIIDIGSRSARYIVRTGENTPPLFAVNEQCAGGTGSFFENQMSRLDMKIEDYSDIVSKAVNIPRISGRCAVFAKTDIIHRQQEGSDISDILLGLCYAMIKNFKAVIVRDLPVKKPVMLCGGVALNSGVIRAVKDVFSLSDSELIIPEHFRAAAAAGASAKADGTFTVNMLKGILDTAAAKDNIPRLAPFDLSENVHITDPECDGVLTDEGAYLGIDIGSTSTDLVLIDHKGRLIDHQYLRTSGNAENAVRTGFENIKKRFADIKISGVGVTGSGRDRIGKLIGADCIKDEITAQAKAAAIICPEADTVFEIGGQDSKFIALKNGDVTDFRMNKICSAGTGSLAEEQAARLGLSLKEFGETALTSSAPADLGERCTVFIESAVAAAAAEGVPMADITAGICFAIVKNYMHKVAQQSLIGEHIVLQGGVAYDPAIVAAFKTYFGKRLTVSPYFAISGAYGAAVLAAENMNGRASRFGGFDLEKITAEPVRNSRAVENKEFYDRALAALTDGYDGKIDPKKKTVGVPLVLVIHKLFPMINAYFKALGFNVLLSEPTNEHTVELAQQYARGEVCYPVKLIYGHMQELAEKNVDYIFMPSIHTMKHEKSGVKHNYGCVYMQTAGRLIAKNLRLEEKGIKLLSPVFDLDFGKKAMVSAMVQTGVQLGFAAPRCMAALLTGSAAVKKYTDSIEAMGKELLDSLRPDEKVLVLITRPYDISDPMLNMKIPQLLLERGCKLITLEHLPGHSIDISDEYPNIYWPFGQHILTGAKLIKNHPNLYAVYLTNHGCGPDTMLSHLFRREMGDKPYLQIEVDEHYSPVGVITRIEAFLNSLEHHRTVSADRSLDIKNVSVKHYDVQHLDVGTAPVYLPYLGLYSAMAADHISSKYNRDVKILPEISEKQIELGRTMTVSKEYVTFTGLLGNVLEAAEGTKEKINVLIPENEGSEADGVFARVISALLEEKGLSGRVSIISPMLESLPEKAADIGKLFRGLLAADIAYAVPRDRRNEFIRSHIPDEAELTELAKKASLIRSEGKILRITGTPMSIYSLGSHIIDLLEAQGYSLRYMPLSEYFLFMWNDAGADCKKLYDIMRKTAAAMGNNSPFATDTDRLIKAADEKFSGFAGANGRYRYALITTASDCSAVINITPRYENVSFVHGLSGMRCPVPLLNISVDGDNDENEMNALRSFLYYI